MTLRWMYAVLLIVAIAVFLGVSLWPTIITPSNLRTMCEQANPADKDAQDTCREMLEPK